MSSNNVDIQLLVGKVWTNVVTQDFSVHSSIDKFLSVLMPSRFFVKSYKMGLWDGKYRFYDSLRERFLSGFLPEVQKMLQIKGYKVEVVCDDSVFPESVVCDTIQLNGIDNERFNKVQLPLLQAMLKAGRGVVRLATGGGKTEIIAGVAKALEDKKILILVHRVELLEQTIKRLEMRLFEPIGRISSTGVDIKRVTVGMVLSIWSKRHIHRDYLKNEVEVIISDECHRSSADSWSKILKVTNASWRYGLSGTPIKGDEVRDRLLVGLTGGVVQGIGVKELVDFGYAVIPEVKFIDCTQLFKNVGTNMKYHVVYDLVYNSPKLWDVVVQAVKWHGQSGLLIFTERVEVCLAIAEYLRRAKVNVGVTYGSLSSDERVDILNKFAKQSIDVLVATVVLDEGVDIPVVSGVMFVGGGKSIVRVMQRIGRGVRKSEYKDKVIVYEFVIDVPYLKKHLMQRVDMYEKEQFKMAGIWKHDGKEFVKSHQVKE